MNIYRGLYEYLLIYFWSKPSFHSSKQLRDMFPASAWGETASMCLLFWGGNSAVSTLSLCGETRRMRSHTSPRWNQHWQDALFVRCNGVIGGPKELRQSQKRWCVGGCLSRVTSPVLKLWFTSFSHRTAKERCSHSFHGGENGCQWKWGYSHFTLCLYLPSPSCRISFELHHRRLLATSPQY